MILLVSEKSVNHIMSSNVMILCCNLKNWKIATDCHKNVNKSIALYCIKFLIKLISFNGHFLQFIFCYFSGESNIIWKESNRIITAGTMIIRKDSRLHLENGYNLRIDNLKESDSGEYVCEIETYGSPIHQTSQLEILGKWLLMLL